MSKKPCPLIKLHPEWGLEQLLLYDGSGRLASQSEVEVEITLKPTSGGDSIVLTPGLCKVYPSETSRGWWLLVKRMPGGTRKE